MKVVPGCVFIISHSKSHSKLFKDSLYWVSNTVWVGYTTINFSTNTSKDKTSYTCAEC